MNRDARIQVVALANEVLGGPINGSAPDGGVLGRPLPQLGGVLAAFAPSL
jgi:hypothetical protein